MDRTLVTYYSRTGRTHRVAQAIAPFLSADVERIRTRRSRTGFLGYWRCGREAYLELPANIEPAAHDPANYGLVVLGTPVWAGRMSSPIRAYVEAHKASFKHVAFFCTYGGSGAQRVFDALAALCDTRPIATLAVTERELREGSLDNKARPFLDRLLTVDGN